MLKSIFYKTKILVGHISSDDEALKQWILKVDTEKLYDKDKDSIDKAKAAIDDLNNGIKPKESFMKAYLDLRKKYNSTFKENNAELDQPSVQDVLNMDALSLDEVKETIDDRKKKLFTKYYNSIIEIYRSSFRGEIVTPTSGGLGKPHTPTNDYIDDQVEVFNPFDDTGTD